MKLFLFVILSLFVTSGLVSQPDMISTTVGDVKIHPILHASVVLEWQGKTIFIDPYGGGDLYEQFDSPDLICITHLHQDHFNTETLNRLDISNATLIAPESVVSEIYNFKFADVITLANSENAGVHDISVEAVPMYNLPDDNTSRHPKGWGNGYVLTIGDKRFYFSGDTEDIQEMRDLEDIDYAFVCMNLPYTMTVEQAADAVLEFKPAVVYPYHYRGKDGFSDVGKFESIVLDADSGIEVRLREWYAQ